jgi:hypothetical protein
MKIKLSKSQWEQIGRTAGWGGFKDAKDAKDQTGQGEIGQNQLLSMPKLPVATDKPWGKPVSPASEVGNLQIKTKKV